MRFFSKLSTLFSQKFFWQTNSVVFNAVFSLFTLFVYNKIFFEKLWDIYPSSTFVSLLILVLFLLMNVACALLFWKHTTKPLAIIFTILNASVFYFLSNIFSTYSESTSFPAFQTMPVLPKQYYSTSPKVLQYFLNSTTVLP